MGFFDRLFGKKKERKPKQKKIRHFLTNAADYGLGEIKLRIDHRLRIDGVMAINELDKAARKNNQSFDFSAMHTSLLEEGALTVHFVCKIADEKYSVYFIYNEDDLLKYKDLVKHVGRTSYPNLIYFSAISMHSVLDPKPIIEPFQLADLRVDNLAKYKGRYVMWWSTDEDPYFHQSKAYDYLAKLNEFIKGYETYMTGYVLRQVRVEKEKEIKRMRLPEQNVSYLLEAPEQKLVLLNLSQEKGIRFLFDPITTSYEYRNRFIRGAVVDLIANIAQLRNADFPVDDEVDPNSYDWFNHMSAVVQQKELSGELLGHEIGIVGFND